MLLRFKNRTWILLDKLIDKGQKEGVVKHIEVTVADWTKLREEWLGLEEDERRPYIKMFRVIDENQISVISPEIIMDETFVDVWQEGKYDIYYNTVRLVPDGPEWTTKEGEDQALAETEKLG